MLKKINQIDMAISKEMTDKKQYRENLIFNAKYNIRDVFNTEELNDLKEFIDETIEIQNSNK